MLALVAFATLPVVNVAGPQDKTRFELTRHIVLDGSLTIEPGLFDHSLFDGRTYSDKAPGMSFLAVPAFELERLAGIARAPYEWAPEGDLSLWGVRLATSGVLFLLAVFLVGRAGESLVAGAGAFTAAVYGVATVSGPLAPTFFEHDAAACLAFAGFSFVWCGRRRRADIILAGLALGTAVVFSYATALIAAAVLVYAAAEIGRRIVWLLVGAVPSALALGAYDSAAFASPFHLSYRYVANRYAEGQHGGFFGIGVPTPAGLGDELIVHRGLLVFSPVLLAAVAGLWLMARCGHRREASLAAFVGAAFLWIDAGYFLPYGGISPGPRFFAPALPFLALGLPFALARFRRTTVALAFVSAALTSGDAATWALGSVRFSDLAKTVWVWFGVNRIPAAGALLVCALAAIGVGARVATRPLA